ncbi:MAG: glycosyltransferase family 2 protein [Myxococcota bacterium]|nr:glycosyltransferase family 2 protein [Myxococcota bacterium]
MHHHLAPALSVIVPAYNEAARIGPTLRRIATYLDALGDPYEVIVVDDGSRDRTRDVVGEIGYETSHIRLLPLERNQGKGAAVRAGVLASSGREVLFSDADLSTPIEELVRLRRALADGADVAIGSRTAATDEVVRTQPLGRRLQGCAFHLLVRALGYDVLTKIGDSQCGFKLFRGDVARALFAKLTLAGFAFDVELLALAHPRFRIDEVAVAWHHAPGSKVRPGIDAAVMLWNLVQLRFRSITNPSPLALPESAR